MGKYRTVQRSPGSESAVRIAAVGDISFDANSYGQFRPYLHNISEHADMLLLAGGLTKHGTIAEAAALAEDLSYCEIPVVAVLGNHDYHDDIPEEIASSLTMAGVTVLESTSTVINVEGISVGIAGTKGFGGGFRGACGSDFGERLMKEFVGETRRLSRQLADNLAALETDLRIALLHFSPTEETLRGERLENYPWLGSYMLADAIDAAGCDLALHGHASSGTEEGRTPGGIAVRNVAQPLIGAAYKVYPLICHNSVCVK